MKAVLETPFSRSGRGVALMRALLLSMAFLAPALAQGFPDVPQGHWAAEAVRYLAERGYLAGYPDGTFDGDRPLTRYEMALILYRTLSLKPELVLDEEFATALRPLLKELLAEMRQVEEAEGKEKGKEEGAPPAPALGDLGKRLDELEAKVSELFSQGKGNGESLAELLVQIAVLKDRLELLEGGQLPQGLAARVEAALRQVYEERVVALEKRMAALEERLAATSRRVEELGQEQRAGFEALKKEVSALKEDQERAVRKVEEALPETHLSSETAYVVGADPRASRAQPGLYTLAGTLTYYPAQRVGYELLTGRTPGELLVGLGALYGTEKQGGSLRGLFSLGGSFGLAAALWQRGEGFTADLDLSLRNYLMPLVVFPEYTGLRVQASGEAAGFRFGLEGHALLTAEGSRLPFLLTSASDPCAKAAYGIGVRAGIPFANFVLSVAGGYAKEEGVAATCTLPPFQALTYEAAVEHDPTSSKAIVPNLGLRLYYGGHASKLGQDFGLSHFGAKASYALDLPVLDLALGGFYTRFLPSGNHAGLPSDLGVGVYPNGEGSLFGGDLFLRTKPLAGVRLGVGAEYRTGNSGSLRGSAYVVRPGLFLEGEGYSASLSYAYGQGVNWNFGAANSLQAVGPSALSRIEGQGTAGGWKFGFYYDLKGGYGRATLAYRMAW